MDDYERRRAEDDRRMAEHWREIDDAISDPDWRRGLLRMEEANAKLRRHAMEIADEAAKIRRRTLERMEENAKIRRRALERTGGGGDEADTEPGIEAIIPALYAARDRR